MTHVNTTDFIRALINARHPDSAPLVPEKIRTANVMPSSYGYPIQFSLVLGSYGVYLKLMIDDFNTLVIRGARLILRSARLDDVMELFRLVSESREELAKWLPWIEFVRSVEDERHIVEQWIYEMQLRSAIHLCVTRDWKIVGLVGTHQIDWINQRTSVGYWMGTNYVGQHYTTESTAVLLNFLFENLRLHRVFIQAATENEPSNRVIKRLGFRWEGLLRENERIKDRFFDHNIYGMTQNDFAGLKESHSVYLGR